MNHKSLNTILISIAILLAVLAVVAGSPYKITINPINTSEKFEIEGKAINVIDAQELANWLMEKRNNFHLVDIRKMDEFNEYHIPFALNITRNMLNSELVESKESFVIYDQSSRYFIDTLQWIIKHRSEEIYVLKGGMDEWINKIIFPDLRERDSLSEKEIKKIYKTSTFFGGQPILNRELPKRKYNREGC